MEQPTSPEPCSPNCEMCRFEDESEERWMKKQEEEDRKYQEEYEKSRCKMVTIEPSVVIMADGKTRVTFRLPTAKK